MEFNIIESDEVGYPKPAYTFECPLCDTLPQKDLDRAFVRDLAWRHLVAFHKVRIKNVDLVVINPEAIAGLQSNKEVLDPVKGCCIHGHTRGEHPVCFDKDGNAR